MRKFTHLLIALLLTMVGYAQGSETFENAQLPGTYSDGSFVGDSGLTFTYGHSRNEGDYPITDEGVMLRRASDSYLEWTVPNGVGDLNFQYRKAFTNAAPRQLEVIVNDIQFAVTDVFGDGSGEQTDVYTFSESIDLNGQVKIKIKNVGSASTNKQAVIDNVSWTAMGNDPTLAITSPTVGAELSPLETPTIEFNVANFDISTNATAGDGDGYIQYQVDQDAFVDYFSTDPIVLNNLPAGSHDVTLQLVDNNGDALSPGVNSTVNFTVNEITDVNNIGALRTSDLDAYYTLTEEVILTYQQNFRGQKYIQDATGAILIDDNDGVLTKAYNQYDGITEISGRLQEHNGIKQFVPIVDADVATSSNNAINIVVLSINDYMANPGAYESQVITFENVTFLDADGTETFDTGENYDITDGVDTSIMRTNFFDADYIGSIIPGGIQPAISGIASHFQGNGQIFPRDMNDLTGAAPSLCEAVTNINVTNIDETTATIGWDAATSASDGYIIDVFEEGANPNVDTPIFSDTVGAGVTTVQATGLTPGTDFDVYVTSDCGGGDTATSTAVTFTTDSTSSAIVDREADNTTGLISTKGNDNTGVYAADYFELTASVDLGDIRFYGFPSEGPDFLPTLTGFNVIIFEHSGTTPDGDPETLGSGFIELTDIAPADFDYVGGVFTINATQANGGQTVTLPAGEYWIAAYPSVSTAPTGDGRWNWLGSLATPTYESVLIDPSDLFGAGATSWTSIATLIAEPFPSLAWTMTEDGDVLPPVTCEVTISSTVEPITKVVFAGIDNSSSASSTDPVEDFTHIEGEVEQGESYTIELEGYTGGNFDSYFTVWIDWNQDGVWDSSPSSEEMYEIGFITNSTGIDGIQATGTINVPQNATLGSATMRIIKNYNTSPTDPCGTYGWGQAEDYTIVVIEPTPLCEVVTNINVTSISETTAIIGWGAATGASDGYIIDVFEEGANPNVDTPIFNDTVAAGVTTVQATGLTPGTDYDVYVTSDCGGGDTATSTAVTFTTEALDCDAVTGISVTAITQTTATVSWTASATATDGYEVNVYQAGTTTNAVFTDTLAAGVTSASITGLSVNTAYDVYVTSDCGNGKIATTSAYAFTTESCDTVTNINVTPITQTTATVTWTASATASDGYEVNVYDAGTTNLVIIETATATETSVDLTGLDIATSYDVVVTSDCGEVTMDSDAFTFTTESCDAVTNIDVTSITQTTATVTWIASATASDGYEVNVYEAGTTTLVTTETATATETSVDLTGLEADTSYDVVVTSDCGEVTMDSDAFTFTTESSDAVTDIDVTTITHTTTTVTCAASATGTADYEVNVYEAGTTDLVTTETATATETSVDLTGLEADTSYDVVVTSDCGEVTMDSDAFTFTTEAIVCDAVTDVEVTDVTAETATVSWTASATAVDGYTVDVYEADADVSTDTPVFTETVTADVTTAEIRGLTHLTEYDVYVTSNCGEGETATSDAVTFTTEDIASIGDFDFGSLEVFPNPVSTDLYLSATKVIEEVQVYNVLGQLVMTQKFNDVEITLDVSSLSTATYLLKVKVDGVVGTVRFVKK